MTAMGPIPDWQLLELHPVKLTLGAALNHSSFQALGRVGEDADWWRHGADAANADKHSLTFISRNSAGILPMTRGCSRMSRSKSTDVQTIFLL
jgi:hypothetical protein